MYSVVSILCLFFVIFRNYYSFGTPIFADSTPRFMPLFLLLYHFPIGASQQAKTVNMRLLLPYLYICRRSEVDLDRQNKPVCMVCLMAISSF